MAQASYSPASQSSNGLAGAQGQQAAFSVAQAVSNLSSTANNLASASNSNNGPSAAATGFKAPQHRHAHHLHSIPPREKSTRTLIIDHMLWVHGRTRFSQARAELGMTDRTGGSSSSKYAHRQRPENFEEEEEEPSDGEDAYMLTAREGGPGHPHNDDEEERISKQDLSLARSLRLRAEGLEKVVTSMLDQPPPVHPILDDDFLDPPTSPRQPPQSAPGDSTHPHTLPNGVRLRLALGTVINDLFARQAPPPPYRYHHDTSASVSQNEHGTTTNKVTSQSVLPRALMPISTVSASPSQRAESPSLSPLIMPSPALSYSPSAQNAWNPKPPDPSPRVRSLYLAGADPNTANSPPAFRCPRHLHTGCEICVEAKSGGRPGPGAGKARTGSSGNLSPGMGEGRNGQAGGKKGGGITGWQDGSGIGSGLARPGVDGNVLRRRSWSTSSQHGSGGGLGAGNTKLSELIPRFMRLSALVAMELGSEARDEEEGASSSDREKDRRADNGWESDDNRRERQELPEETRRTASSSPSMTQTPPNLGLNKMSFYALRPSREWYLLLAGLLTRAILEGYLTAGWRGLEAVECLLAVGMDIPEFGRPSGLDGGPSPDQRQSRGDDQSLDGGDLIDDNSDFESLDPDGLPNLKDATRILFPSLQGQARKDDAEAEFVIEMVERLKRFYDIPASTPDVSTHMEDLAWRYPAEPVERAALRFCEAVAKWRGKPELETYKKKPPHSSQNKDIPPTPGGSTMTIDSLVHSNPTSPTISSLAPQGLAKSRRPSIEKYFTQPSLDRQNGWNRSKRRRSEDEGRSSPSKRIQG